MSFQYRYNPQNNSNYNPYNNPYNSPLYNPYGGQPVNPTELAAEKRRLRKLSNACGLAVIGFIVMSLVLMGLISVFVPNADELGDDAVFNEALMLMSSVFTVFLPFLIIYLIMKKRNIAGEIPLGRPYDGNSFTRMIPVTLMVCFIGSIMTSMLSGFVDSMFGIEFSAPEDVSNYTTVSGVLLSVLSTAVAPAIAEEFAIRGVVMQSLRRYGDWFAVVMSAFVFALMHGNMIQIPFAFVAGIGLGYCAIRTGTLWTGIVVHFLNNLAAVLSMTAYANLSESEYSIFTVFLYGFVFVFGVLCAVIDIRKIRRPFACMQKSRIYGLKTGKKAILFIFSIPMLVAIAFLCFETAQYIST